MSFDLKLTSGDLSFSSTGDFEKVTGINKLEQDIRKILLTPIGVDPSNPQYGSRLQELLGRTMGLDTDTMKSLVAKNVAEAMQFLQTSQILQSTTQELDFDEVLGQVDAIAVEVKDNKRIEISLAITSVTGQRKVFALT